jgi:SAM-dependent methyltransferase
MPRHPKLIYAERVERLLHPETLWLDVGCGHTFAPISLPDGSILAPGAGHASRGVGIDLDLDALLANRFSKHRLQASVLALPFKASSFDLVTANMVFEHLPDPRPALSEIRRVLRPGGRMLLHTPSLFWFGTLVARIIPNRCHAFIVTRIENREAKDVFPTYYAFNRASTVTRLLHNSRFRVAQLELLESPGYYHAIPLLGTFERVWNIAAQRLPALRSTLLVEARVD